MTDRYRDSLDLRDEDRLPWLEAVEDEDDRDSISPFKVAIALLLFLALLALIVGGIYWVRSGGEAATGDGDLIAAPPGDYKVRPQEPGGMDVQGKGDAAFATSAGAAPEGAIDLNAVPEVPVTAAAAPVKKAAPEPAAGRSATAEIPESGGMLTAPPPAARAASTAAAAGGGSVIQLGAFDSEGVANAAWKKMSSRFAFLAEMQSQVMSATVGGRTYYRLRTDAGSSDHARDICGRLKVAGENCMVIAQ